MFASKPLSYRHQNHFVNQILVAIIQDRQFDAHLAACAATTHSWTAEQVSLVLRSIPTYFFQSARSIGRQNSLRHRAPLRQRRLKEEEHKFRKNVLVLGPGAHRDLHKLKLGVDKAMQFYYWVETHFQFCHDEMTCREMACVLARANRLKALWNFLKEMSRKSGIALVTTETVTCLIKVLAEEGLVNEALAAFYRMKQFHCKPDVYAYNTVIAALCRVGNFKKAKFLLEQMELPGFRCPPDVFTYTILISSYCKFSMQTGSRKAIRHRMWKANHLFRIMLFKGYVPDVVTYNALIDGCCKTHRIERALELFEDMKKRGCVPDKVTYNSFIRYFSAVNEIDKAVEMLRTMQKLNHRVPTSSSYTPIIHALCEAGRVGDARDFLVEWVDRGSIPREYTYTLVCNSIRSVGETHTLDDDVHKKIKEGIDGRYRQTMKRKPIMTRKGYDSLVEV